MYGLLIGTWTIISIFFAEILIKKKNISIDNKEFWNLIPMIFLLSIFGGRLYHVLDNYIFYIQNPINILYFWRGGFGIFGSIILVFAFLYIYTKKTNKNFFTYSDILCFFAPIIIIFGRLGNIFNGELSAGIMEVTLIIVYATYYFRRTSLNFGSGLLTALIFISYALIRITEESFRNPENSFILKQINLTYVISLCMLITGFGIIFKRKILIY